MLRGKSVAVVVPAYEEEKLIGKTLGTMPDFVDTVIVVNDASTDRTLEIVEEQQKADPRISSFLAIELVRNRQQPATHSNAFRQHRKMQGQDQRSACNERNPAAAHYQQAKDWLRRQLRDKFCRRGF